MDLMGRVVTVAQSLDEDKPPEDVVRCAKAIGSLLRPRQSPFRLLARLVYDSLQDPVPAGMRSDDRASHHALYEAGKFCLDLRIEQEKGSPVISLVGQVTNRETPDSDMPAAPVLLLARKDVVAHAVYNRFGEFRMEYAPATRLRLRVSLGPAGTGIEVPLGRPGMSSAARRGATALKRLRSKSRRRVTP